VLKQRTREFIGTGALLAGDLLFQCLAFYLTYRIRVDLIPLVFSEVPNFKLKVAQYWWILPIWVGILVYEGGYTKRLTYWDEVKTLWKVSFFSAVATVFVLFVRKKAPLFSRTMILVMPLVALGLWPLWRTWLKKFLYRVDLLKRKVLIAGAGEKARRVLKAIRQEPNLGYEVVGFVSDEKTGPRWIEGLKVYKFLDRIDRYLCRCRISNVIIALEGKKEKDIAPIINRVHHRANSVLYVPEISGISVLCTELKHFFSEQSLALEIKNNLESPFNYALKRTMDYLGAILLLPFVLPIMLLIAIAIKLTSPGPVIYSHERLGKGNKRFRCLKFRTMYLDADERLKELLERDPEARAEWEKHWKLKNDPRVTPVGRFLRKTSLDELPQIFNVLKGQMSLVGPRPYLPREEENMGHYKGIILSVPPGVTGLWQVSGRSNTTYRDRLEMDSWYVRNWTPWLDVVILI
ncbi:MAG: undecaprenyl-phosphate galactose phosphotransferase WbaP, partial [Nitrospirae bacterium]